MQNPICSPNVGNLASSLFRFAGFAVLLGSTALAQSAKPAAAAGPASVAAAAGEEVVALPEFTVSSDESGWVATNALSGTRTNINLRELPRSVQVMTSEFLADIGALTLTDATDYMSGITNVGNQDQTNDANTYQVRGFRQNKNYRDGQREPFAGMLYDSATIDRVEVVKGPSSLLSGLAEPGGAINTISKLPRGRRETSLAFRGDNWGMRRGEIDTSIPVNKRLSTRFVFVRQAGEGWQQFAWSNRSVYYGALSYKLAENTRVTSSAEYFDYLASPPSPRSTVASSSPLNALTWHGNGDINGLNLNGVFIPWEFSPLGPNNRRDEQIFRFANQLQHRFNDTFSLRLAANFSRVHRNDLRLSGTQITTKVVNGVTVPGSDALSSTLDVETVPTYSGLVDFVGKFRYLGLTHQAVLEGEYVDTTDVRNRDNTPALTPYVFGADTQPAWEQMLDYSRYTLPQNRLNNKMHRRALSFTNVIGAFRDRAHVLLGLRRDEGSLLLQNPIATTAIGRYQRIDEKSTSPTGGLVVAVTKDLSAYYSYSRSFAGVPQSAIDMFGNPLTKQVEGRGYDAGIKTSFWQNRINLNAAGFMIDQVNLVRQVSTNEIAAAGLNPTLVTGARSTQDQSARTKGWEMDAMVKPFNGYQVAVTYTNLHAFVTANKANPAAVGGPVSQGPGRESWSIFHKYEFARTFVKGLALTQSFVFRDSRRPTVPGFTRQDVSASYRTSLWGKRVSFSLRVQNLTDLQYWEGFQARGAPRTTSLSVGVKF